MAIDFRANQIRVNKIISSGSSIIIYPSGAASDLAGTINTSIFPQTGIGSDVFFFVSGGATRGGSNKNASVFGGVLVSSGTFYALTGMTGSLTKVIDGTSYLIGSGGVTVVTNSNGSITIGFSGSSGGTSFAFSSTSIAFSGSSGLTGTPGFYFDNNNNEIFLYADSSKTSNNGLKFSSTGIYRLTSSVSSNKHDLNLNSADAYVLSASGGDVNIIGGNSSFKDDSSPSAGGSISLIAGSGSKVANTVVQLGGFGGGVSIYPGKGGNSTGTARGGQGGSILLYGAEGGTSTGNYGGSGSDVYLYAGNAGSGSSGSGIGGNVILKSGDGYFGDPNADSGYFSIDVGSRNLSNASSNASIRIDSSAQAKNVLINYSHFLANSVSDCYFIVGGSSTRKALFIGDLVSSASIKSFSGFTGSLTKLTDGTSYLIAGSNITITSGSNGSITIDSTGGGSSLPSGSINGIYYYSSGGPALTVSGSSRVPFVGGGVTAPQFSRYISPIYVGTGNDSTIDSNTAILLGQTVGRIKQEVALNTYSDVYKFSAAYHVFGGSDPGAYLNGTKIVYKSGGEFVVENGEGSNIFPIQINGSTFTLRSNSGNISIGSLTDYFTFNTVPVGVFDTQNTSVVNVLTLYHKVGFTTPAAGVGTRLTFANSDASQTKTDSFYIDSIFVTASTGQQYNKTIFYSTSGSYMGSSAPESKVLEFTNDEFVFGKQPVIHFNGPMRTENYNITGSAYTLNPLVDSGSIRLTNTGSRTITLPASSSVLSKFFGCEWRIHDAARTADSGSITITAPSGVTLNSVLTSSVVLFTKGSAVLVRLITANTWETIGI